MISSAPSGRGGSATSSTSAASPRTSIPFAINAVLRLLTKNIVGLSTETVWIAGLAPIAIVPRISRRVLPGSRRVRMDVGVPSPMVVTSLSTTSPVVDGSIEKLAGAPAASPGAIVTRAPFSLN